MCNLSVQQADGLFLTLIVATLRSQKCGNDLTACLTHCSQTESLSPDEFKNIGLANDSENELLLP